VKFASRAVEEMGGADAYVLEGGADGVGDVVLAGAE